MRHPVVISNERKHADETLKLRRGTERVFVCALNHIRKPVGNEAGIELRRQIIRYPNMNQVTDCIKLNNREIIVAKAERVNKR